MASLVDSKVVEEGKKEEEVALTLGLSNGRFYQLTLAKGDGEIRFVGRQLIMFGERGLEEMNCKHGVILYGRRCISCGRERMAKLQHMQIEDRVDRANITLTIGFSNHHFHQGTFRKGDGPTMVATMLQEMARQILDNDNLREGG